MAEYLFSFENYVKLLREMKQTGVLMDYAEAKDQPRFVLLRHDVEFSPKRALELAEIEAGEGVSSSFFFQLTNHAYNILSEPNLARIHRICELGHHVGLHFHLHGSDDPDEIRARLAREADVFSGAVGFRIDRFSYHRPSALVLEQQISLPGLINPYAPEFFTYTKDPSSVDFTKSVKYIADSRNEWSYLEPWTAPCAEFFAAYPKVQVLCHPYSWSAVGYPTLENLRSVIAENREEFINTLNSETKYVRDYLDRL